MISVTEYENGAKRVMGIFQIKDKEGFPLDMAIEECEQRGWEINWPEALADAGRQSYNKWNAFINNIENILGEEDSNRISLMFSCGLMEFLKSGVTFEEACESLYKKIHNKRK